MTEFQLVLRNLRHHWRTNLAVVMGVIAGTAVIGGALIVGDSVRGSLRQMSLDRLGRIDHALTGPRFFRQDLANTVAASPKFADRFSSVAPALLITGTFVAEHGKSTSRAGRVQVFGCEQRFWDLIEHGDALVPNIEHGDAPVPSGQDVVLNARLARQLEVRVGDTVSLWVEPPSAIPRESLLEKRDGNFREIPLTVRAILDEQVGAARLSLKPTQMIPLNAFVPLDTLQQGLDLAAVAPSRRNRTGAPARVNTLFVAARSPADQTAATAALAAESLDADLAAALTPAGIGLRIVQNRRGYFSLEAEQQILPDVFVDAALKTARQLDLPTSPVLAYLANELINAKDPKKFSMYSIVAGLDPVTTKTPPFGPFVWASTPPDHPLGPHDIVLNEWLAADLGVKAGEEVRLRYHVVGSHGELPEEEQSFRIAGILKLEGTPAADPGLVPEVKGITDAKTLRDWDQPFPMKLERITPRDEAYWNAYHATPKSFVSLQTAQKLWGSRFGSLTSLRVAPKKGETPQQSAAEFQQKLLKSLTPAQTGMQFQPVKYDGVHAAVGSNDFSQLFLGFSFFLILAATILVGLIFRLGIERRGTTIGLLSAVGFTPGRLRRLFLIEGLVLVVIGGLLGIAAAVGYAEVMILGLTLWWNRAVGTQFLSVFLVPSTLAIGWIASVLAAAVAVLWGLRQLRLLSPRELLSGATEPAITAVGQRRRGRRSIFLGMILFAIAAVVLAASSTGLLSQSEAFEGLSWTVVIFFVDGIVLLIAGVMLVAGLLDGEHSAAVRGRGFTGVARLGARNTARHRQRSIASVSLIAAATFVIVAVAAGRRNPAVEKPDIHSGNGGFRLIAESTVPILYDLNESTGRNKLDFHIPAGSPDERLVAASIFIAFRIKPGEDASCLNVYQTRLPTILGVPESMVERGGFRFIGSREKNPWTLLEQNEPDGTIPVFGDANTLQYSLHKGMGETVGVPDDVHPKAKLKIAGMLDGSVFQGVLLMSEANFRRLFPGVVGYRYFLVANPWSASDADHLAEILESQLAPYGFDAERVADRLADFLAVQNTYLSTFQTLGGLGLLLGTLGLATVMIRNVLERRAELALLSALGFRPFGLAWLIVVEAAVLLVCGLATGSIAALVAMVPHLTSTGADVPWNSLALILAIVFLVGITAALAASVQAARTRILEGLRSE